MFENLDEIELLKAINETGKAISALAEQQEALLKEHGLPERRQTLSQLLAPGLKLLFYREIELKNSERSWIGVWPWPEPRTTFLPTRRSGSTGECHQRDDGGSTLKSFIVDL